MISMNAENLKSGNLLSTNHEVIFVVVDGEEVQVCAKGFHGPEDLEFKVGQKVSVYPFIQKDKG